MFEAKEVVGLKSFAKVIKDADEALPADLPMVTAKAAFLLIAAAKAMTEMAYIARHSVAGSGVHAKALDKGAQDASKAAKQTGAMANGALNWARAVDPQLAALVKQLTQEAVNSVGWNSGIVAAGK